MDETAIALAESTRRLMDAVVRTEADAATRARAAAAIEEAAGLLSAATRPSMRWPEPEQLARGVAPYNPVIGRANPYAPPMRCRLEPDGSVSGTVTLQPIHEGPPAAVHGGIVATLLDQLLGHAVAAAEAPGVTMELTVRYRRPTPYSVPLGVRARHQRTDGRIMHASAEIVADGVTTAEATGTFLRVRADQASGWPASAAQSRHGRSPGSSAET